MFIGGVSSPMAKFIFSLGDENYRVLASEAKTRDITIQELIRAVIIPDWMRHNMDLRSLKDPAGILPHTSLPHTTTGFLNRPNGGLPSPIGRLKT